MQFTPQQELGIIQNASNLLERVDMKGAEVNEYLKVRAWLQATGQKIANSLNEAEQAAQEKAREAEKADAKTEKKSEED